MTLTKSDIKSRLDYIIIDLMVDKDIEKMVEKLMQLSVDITEEIEGNESS